MENKEVVERLDKIIGLLAIQGREKEEQVHILYALGFNSKQISSMMGIPDGTIRKIKAKRAKKR